MKAARRYSVYAVVLCTGALRDPLRLTVSDQEKSLCGWVFSAERAALLSELRSCFLVDLSYERKIEASLPGLRRRDAARLFFRSAVAAPLFAGGHKLGVLCVFSTVASAFTLRQLPVVTSYGHLLAQVLAYARRYGTMDIPVGRYPQRQTPRGVPPIRQEMKQ